MTSDALAHLVAISTEYGQLNGQSTVLYFDMYNVSKMDYRVNVADKPFALVLAFMSAYYHLLRLSACGIII